MTAFSPVTLTGDRVALRFVREEDVAPTFAMLSNPEVTRFWAEPPMTARAQAAAAIADARAGYASGESLELAVERRTDGAFLGRCTLFHLHEASRRAEIGYVLDRPHWGAGYMHEALCLLLDHAFGTMRLHRVEADIDPRNAGSERTLTRLGFQYEGRLRERWIVAGEISDTAMYGLLDREWQALRGTT